MLDRFEILVILVVAGKAQLGFQWNGECETTVDALIDVVFRRVDRVIHELEHEVLAGIADREILSKNLVKTFILSFFRRRFNL